MATVTMNVKKKMKDDMLNTWRAKTNYGVIVTTVSGQTIPDIGDSEALTFGAPDPVTGGSKITHQKTGGLDLVVSNNQTVLEFRITRNNTSASAIPHASTNIGELYTYGGVFRVNKIEITLT